MQFQNLHSTKTKYEANTSTLDIIPTQEPSNPRTNTVDNIAIAHKVPRKVRKKQQTTAHFPMFDNKPIAHFPIFDNKPIAHFPFIFCQQTNCAFPFLSHHTNT